MLLVQRRNIVIAFVITILLTFSALLLPTQTNANQTMKLEYIIAQVGNEQIVVDLIDYAMALANTKQDFLVYLKNGKSAPDVKGVVINGKSITILDYAIGIGQSKTTAEIYNNTTSMALTNAKKLLEMKNGSPVTEPYGSSSSKEFKVMSIE